MHDEKRGKKAEHIVRVGLTSRKRAGESNNVTLEEWGIKRADKIRRNEARGMRKVLKTAKQPSRYAEEKRNH